MSGPLPAETETYRLLQMGLSLSEADDIPAERAAELVAIDNIYKHAGR